MENRVCSLHKGIEAMHKKHEATHDRGKNAPRPAVPAFAAKQLLGGEGGLSLARAVEAPARRVVSLVHDVVKGGPQ